MPDGVDGSPLDLPAALLAGWLPCGRSVDELLDQISTADSIEPDIHQQSCVHCRAARQELGEVWAMVADVAADPVTAPPSLTRRVMDRVHTLSDNTWYTAELTDVGVLRIAARVVAAVARDTARTVPGVRAALGRSTRGHGVQVVDATTRGHRHPHAAVGVLGRTAAVDLAVALTYGQNVYTVAALVQRRVIQALRDTVGLRQVIVNVTVDDIRPVPHSDSPIGGDRTA